MLPFSLQCLLIVYILVMRIKMKSLKGDVFNVEIDESATFLELKEQVHSIRSTPISHQKLVYKGKVMDDKMIIGEIGIRESDFVVIMNYVPKKKPETGLLSNVEKQLQVKPSPKKQESPTSIPQNNQPQKVQPKPKKQKSQQTLLEKNLGQEALQLLLNSLSGGAGSVQIENYEGIIDQMIAQNPQLAQHIQQRPEILQEIMMSGVQYMDDDDDDDDEQYVQEEEYQLELTAEEDEAVKRVQHRLIQVVKFRFPKIRCNLDIFRLRQKRTNGSKHALITKLRIKP